MDLLLQNSGTTVFLPSPPLFAEIRLIDSVPRGQFRLIRAATFPLLLLLFSSFFFMFHFISRSTYSYPFSLIPRIITIIVTFIYRDEEARVFWFLKEYEFEMNFIVVISFFFWKEPSRLSDKPVYTITISPQLALYSYSRRYRRVDTLLTGNPSGVLCQLA